MEYICEDLLNYISKRAKIPENTAKVIFKQIIEGLHYLHSKNIIHRDIKLDNVLIGLDNTIKICDFGVSRIIKQGDIMHEHCGTPAYIAPEIFLNKGYKGFYCDIWSAGVTLYYMLSGSQPFKGSHLSKLHSNILEMRIDKIENISFEAENLIKGMLQLNPKKRLTIKQILNHPWIKEINTNTKINLFTEAERVVLSKYEVNYLTGLKDELIEKFTYKNVNTIREEKKHHCETRSLILTPYNSEISKYSNTSIEIERKICKFCPSVKQLDLKYELNNNAQFDNGIINTENLSFLNDEDDINTSPISISPHLEKGNGRVKEIFPTINTIFVEYIENNIGYDQEYLRSELKKKEINYATATYYLISKDDV